MYGQNTVRDTTIKLSLFQRGRFFECQLTQTTSSLHFLGSTGGTIIIHLLLYLCTFKVTIGQESPTLDCTRHVNGLDQSKVYTA